jgi:NAD(P)-dependent dehydrogenase (short-subunit alcohol dehydrogenase family)
MRVPAAATKTVLLTGCSSGIGAACAGILRSAGWRVFPTARKEADLERLRGEGYEAICLDLADEGSVAAAAAEFLEKTEGRPGGVICNAGYCQAGAVEDLPREALRAQFETNVLGPHQLIRALLPAFKRLGAGRIVQVSSVYGRIAAPWVGAYCASKYAVEALGDALRIELRGSGVWSSLVEPGGIVSNFRKNAVEALATGVDMAGSEHGAAYGREIERRRRQKKKPDFFTRAPEEVAPHFLHALESARPRRRYRVTPSAWLVEGVVRVVPQAWTDGLLARKAAPGGKRGEK